MFNKLKGQDLSKASIEEKAAMERVKKTAEAFIDEARKNDLTLGEFHAAASIAQEIVATYGKRKKITDYVQPTEKRSE